MKSSKVLSFIGVFVLMVMAAGVTWATARSDRGSTGEKTTNSHAYLPIVSRPVDPVALAKEQDALVALYQSTNGDEWYESSGWLGSDDHCSWYGVRCDNGRVITLDLSYNELNGPIPPELGNLTGLEWLNLYYNQLSGLIPPELGSLSNLGILDLGGNQLSGPIPPELSNLGDLRQLQLGSNQLSGPIPSALGNLGNLENLVFDGNQLSGPIPPELSNLSNLLELHLSSNQLSSPIPPEMGNLGNLDELGLSNNQLSGPIPHELVDLSNLQYLYLEENRLSCWETLGVLEWALSVLDHSWDDPPGTTFCGINNFAYLPSVLRPWEPFQQMERDALIALYQSNNGDAWYYNYGWLSPYDHCGWMRVVCDNGRVTKLELTGNNLSGPIPRKLGNLSNLQELALGYNQLVGPIPKELSNLSNLKHLWLAHNQLSCWETREVLQWAQGVSCYYPVDCFDYPTPGETICPNMPEEQVLMPVLFGGYSPEDPVPQGYLETEDLVVDSLAADITHHWTLDLTFGDAITITVAPGHSADILLSLFDSDGLVHQQNMSPAGEVETITELSITQAGEHDLVVQTVQGKPTD